MSSSLVHADPERIQYPAQQQKSKEAALEGFAGSCQVAALGSWTFKY